MLESFVVLAPFCERKVVTFALSKCSPPECEMEP